MYIPPVDSAVNIQQLRARQDVPYLQPYINELLRERDEKHELDTLAKSKQEKTTY